MSIINFRKNNCSDSLSPYLRQHADNPVWWQEWSQEAIDHAASLGKPLFVSVGYSTCHWCHVMAAEAFTSQATADFLNEHFVCIKVDREVRPDIDTLLMRYLIAISGAGGWPLNAFLTPTLKPIYALTYAPPATLKDIAARVQAYYAAKGECVEPFTAEESELLPAVELELVAKCRARFDVEYGGFGQGPKFPPHCTLLFLLYFDNGGDAAQKEMIGRSLEGMLTGGLFDHLQGGLYRYCVDRSWTIPHFEKMLYDQALGLWVLSMAYRVLGQAACKTAALKMICCLEETFRVNDLYRAGFDADTHHEEGITYVWGYDELQNILSPEEFRIAREVYALSPEGNFEGQNHLIRKTNDSLDAIEQKLLDHRRARPQPFADNKIMTAWNALTGIAYVHAARYLGDVLYLRRAEDIANALLRDHFDGTRLARCSIDGVSTGAVFLEDAAALLLLLTFLEEDRGSVWSDRVEQLAEYLQRFRRGDGWAESDEKDLGAVSAGAFDHPVPSSVAMAQWALARKAILRGEPAPVLPFTQPVYHDAYNIAAMLGSGAFHLMQSPEKLPWPQVPVNSVQRRGIVSEDCFRGACRRIV
jgi:uncharacterized protein YyaL (SSP411 family)